MHIHFWHDVTTDGNIIRLAHRGQLASGCYAAYARKVENHHIDGPRFKTIAHLRRYIIVLTTRNRHVEYIPNLR